MLHFPESKQLSATAKVQTSPSGENRIIDTLVTQTAAQTAYTLSEAYDMCLLSIILFPHPHKGHGNHIISAVRSFRSKSTDLFR